MVELEKRITGDWIVTREAATDLYTLNDYFKIPSRRLIELCESLKAAVEGGLLEYKRSVLQPVFICLEDMKYYSKTLEELESHRRPLKGLVFTTLVQKLICAGVIPLPRMKTPEPVETENLAVNLIIGDIKDRIKDDPPFKNHPAVKNIFMQIAIYQNEKAKMEELLPKISEEKQETFRENFQNIFNEVFSSIRKNYGDILKEEEAGRQAEEAQKDLFRQLSLNSLSTFLTEQAREFARIGSTLTFAVVDKYKTRELLVNLHHNKEHFLTLIVKERENYRKLCSEIGKTDPDNTHGRDDFLSNCTQDISFRLRDELIRTLERLSRSEENTLFADEA